MTGSVKLSNFFPLPVSVLIMEQVLSYKQGGSAVVEKASPRA